MKKLLLLPALSLVVLTSALLPTRSSEDDERAAVERAVLDYVEAVYELKPELIERSVHPDLAKYGFARRSSSGGSGAYQGMAMNFEELLALAETWNEGRKRAGDDAPKEVEVLDLSDQTAAAKLTAIWGIDYMHLAKFDGKWMIYQVMWQTPPPAK